MLSRIRKCCSLKAIQHNNLFATIEEIGFETMLYSFCSKKGRVYKIIDKVKRCSKYMRCGRSCNRLGHLVGISL